MAASGFQVVGGNFAKSPWGGASFGALSGGIGAELSGGNFWRGAGTGATVSLLNHYGHQLEDEWNEKRARNKRAKEYAEEAMKDVSLANREDEKFNRSNLSTKEKFNLAYDKTYNEAWGDAYVRGSYNGLRGRKFNYPKSSSFPKSLRRAFWFLSSGTPYEAGLNAGYIDGNYFGYIKGYKQGYNRRINLIKAGGYVPGGRFQSVSYDPVSPLLPKWFERLGW